MTPTATARAAHAASGMRTADVALVVLAKAPRPGRVKTRLCPPCTPEQAAELAAAALADTLAAVRAVASRGHVLVLEPGPGAAVPGPLEARRLDGFDGVDGVDGVNGFDGDDGFNGVDGVDVIVQRGGGLDERLAAAFADVGGPALLVGMDTPQVTPALLEHSIERLCRPGVDAVLGHAVDGGFWAVGLRSADPEVFLGVPMSTPGTGAAQRRRLDALGLRVSTLPVLRDVDTADDARRVAAAAPATRFAGAVRRVIGGELRPEPEPSWPST